MTHNTKRAGWQDHGAVRLLAVLTLAAVLAALVAPSGILDQRSASAELAGSTEQVTVNTDRLNLRTEPGTGAAIVRLLYRGDVLQIVGGPESTDGYTWYQVDGDTGRVWVASKFLSWGADSDTGGSAEFATGNRTLTTSNLNFRTEPGTDSAVIRVLKSGTLLTITDGPAAASGYTWYQGRTTAATGGDTGWVIAPGISMAPEMPDPGREYDTGNVVHVTFGYDRAAAHHPTPSWGASRMGQR